MKECFFKQATETMIIYNFKKAFEYGCTRCSLSERDTQPILYKGNLDSKILLVGEAPGKVEEEQKTPFVGPAGKLLDNIMGAISLDTEKDMCLTNSLYCRPAAPENSGKQNHTPKAEQLKQCQPFLHNFIKIIRPDVIIACGRTALHQLTGNNKLKMKDHEGKWTEYIKFGNGSVGIKLPMFVMTHPAAILHMSKDIESQKKKKKEVWQYMQYFIDTWEKK